MPLTLRRLGAALALMLVTAACSAEDDKQPEAGASPPAPSTPGSSSTAAADAECTVPGYVATDKETVENGRGTLVYASSRTLSPTSTMSGRDILQRVGFPPVRVSSPSGRVPSDIRRAVLGSVGEPWGRGEPPKKSGPHPFSLHNDSNVNVKYVHYRGAQQLGGSWSAERCGTPWNDGTEVLTLSGKFSTLTRILPPRVHRCGAKPAGEIERAASRMCRL